MTQAVNKTVRFKNKMIAPCGMNCGTCLGFLREKNRCPGCRMFSPDKAVTVRRCIIVKCSYLERTKSKFCYECEKFPCRRIKQLDKRYMTRYRTSFIQNLTMIKEKGIEEFLGFEAKRRTCPGCGSVICVHRPFCLKCKISLS